MPSKKTTIGRNALRYGHSSFWHVTPPYKLACTFRETQPGLWRLSKKDTGWISFPTSINEISRAGKHWAVEFRPQQREFLGFKIASKTLRIPLATVLQLGNRVRFNNEMELLNQLKTTADSINSSEVAATLRESLQLTP